MRVNAINMLRQSASAIRPAADHGYSFCLNEMADHLALVRDGKHTWEEFAELYCLTERDRKPEAAHA